MPGCLCECSAQFCMCTRHQAHDLISPEKRRGASMNAVPPEDDQASPSLASLRVTLLPRCNDARVPVSQNRRLTSDASASGLPTCKHRLAHCSCQASSQVASVDCSEARAPSRGRRLPTSAAWLPGFLHAFTYGSSYHFSNLRFNKSQQHTLSFQLHGLHFTRQSNYYVCLKGES